MKQKTIDSLKEKIEADGLMKTSEQIGITIDKLVELLNLDFKKFNDITFTPHPYGNGVAGKIMFDNGYGASVVCGDITYGGKKGLYELAVLNKDGKLTYDTPITDNVIGYLTPEQVTNYLIQIQDLK